MDDGSAISYLKDLGQLIKEKSLEVKRNVQATSKAYDIRVLMAFHDVVSLMQSQAEAFGMPYEEIGLSDFDPETDLLVP